MIYFARHFLAQEKIYDILHITIQRRTDFGKHLGGNILVLV